MIKFIYLKGMVHNDKQADFFQNLLERQIVSTSMKSANNYMDHRPTNSCFNNPI